MTTKAQKRELSKDVRAIERVKPEARRASYSIKGVPGLRLVVHPSGRKVWFSVYQVGKGKGRQRRWQEIGPFNVLGSKEAKVLTLEEAIAQATAHKVDVGKGIDPQAPKKFSELFNSWLEEHAKKKLDTWADEEARYKRQLLKPLGERLVSEIERKDVREIRDNVAQKSGPIESNRVVSLFNRVMNWAVDEDHAKFNPAARLKKVGEEKRRERVLSGEEIARLWGELDAALGVDETKGGLNAADLVAAEATRRAFKLLFLTGQRRGEVIGMRKDELDLTEGDAWWALPGERTKNGLPHRVPLTEMAVSVLKEAIAASGGSAFVFPSHRSKKDAAIRPDAVTKALKRLCKRMDPEIVGLGPHDIRRTVGQNMRKLGVSVEDRGYVFNHVSGAKAKVTSWNYDPGEHDDEKRIALARWERELARLVRGPISNNVLLLHRERA